MSKEIKDIPLCMYLSKKLYYDIYSDCDSESESESYKMHQELIKKKIFLKELEEIESNKKIDEIIDIYSSLPVVLKRNNLINYITKLFKY
jgi:hypothetical protein